MHTYLIASWWDWQFGGSYGHRGFVDVLPLFALGLAAAFECAPHPAPGACRSRRRRRSRWSRSLVFQMLQYWYGIVPFSDTTWPQYRELFLQWR